MREHGIDISGRRSKHLEEFAGQRFGYVITLCDRVREVCPEFPGHPQLIHWSIADPAGEADARAAFRRVAAGLRTRIGFLLGPALPVVRRGAVLTLLAAAATGLLVALAGGPLPH